MWLCGRTKILVYFYNKMFFSPKTHWRNRKIVNRSLEVLIVPTHQDKTHLIMLNSKEAIFSIKSWKFELNLKLNNSLENSLSIEELFNIDKLYNFWAQENLKIKKISTKCIYASNKRPETGSNQNYNWHFRYWPSRWLYGSKWSFIIKIKFLSVSMAPHKA